MGQEDAVFRLVEETPIHVGERSKWRLTFQPVSDSEETQITLTVDAEAYLRFDGDKLYSRDDISRLSRLL